MEEFIAQVFEDQIPEIIAAQKEPYQMATNKKWGEMVKYYEENDQSVLFPMTIARDSALHIAVYSNKKETLGKLMSLAGDVAYWVRNKYGNTILHQAAITGNLQAVELLVNHFPDLVSTHNNYKETPIFMAASFGQTEIVKFLFDKAKSENCSEPELSDHYMREDGTSILHVAVQGEYFETALYLLEMEDSLANVKDNNGMTALHLLANMSSAFKSGYPIRTVLKKKWAKVSSICKFSFEGLFKKNIPPKSNEQIRDIESGDDKKNNLKFSEEKGCCGPIRKGASHAKTKYELAMELAKLLIKKDFSWGRDVEVEANVPASGSAARLRFGSNGSEEHREPLLNVIENGIMEIMKQILKERENNTDGAGEGSSSGNIKNDPPKPLFNVIENGIMDIVKQILEEQEKEAAAETKKKDPPIPLFIATENGITDIVKQILEVYPQAVEYTDEKGRNILHIAIMHRRQEIFDLVTRKTMTENRLKLGIDKKGYTLLHHAADTEHYIGGSKPGPALQLQEELKWFERVEKLVPSHYALHRAKISETTSEKTPSEDKVKELTPLELFKKTHKDQLKEAQQWIKDTSQSCSTVAVLLATVVFAAAYTAPGGYDKGVPVFLHSPYFLFFTIMDVVSLACSLTAVVIFLSILTSPFELQEFRRTLPRKLTFGFTLLFLSVITTMLMFGATILLTIHLEQKLTTSLLSVAAFFPVLVLALMQYHLYFVLLDTMADLSSDTMKALRSYLKYIIG